jgi:hypothetical protein
LFSIWPAPGGGILVLQFCSSRSLNWNLCANIGPLRDASPLQGDCTFCNSKREGRLDHATAIKSYVQAMLAAPDQHILIVEGPPGWGKTEAVDHAMRLAGVEGAHLGAYSTPLHFFNFLAANASRAIVVDDTAGLLGDPISMALLKAATWPRPGSKRILRWGSTTSRADAEEFEFTGKFVVVCNAFPRSPDGGAIRSRGFSWRLCVAPELAKSLILQASADRERYPVAEAAAAVAEFLVSKIDESTIGSISYRTLAQAYRLAEVHPDAWRELVAPLIPPVAAIPEELAKALARRDIPVKEQARIFEEKTGLKERSFYYYRRRAIAPRRSARKASD